MHNCNLAPELLHNCKLAPKLLHNCNLAPKLLKISLLALEFLKNSNQVLIVDFFRNSLLLATFRAKLKVGLVGPGDNAPCGTMGFARGGRTAADLQFKDSGFKTRMPFLAFRRCRSWNSTAGDMEAMTRMWCHLGMAHRRSTTDERTPGLSFRSGFEKPMSARCRLGRLPVREGQPWKRGGA